MKEWDAAQIKALRILHDRGAFLVRATEDKVPIRKLRMRVPVEDESGNLVITEDEHGVPIAKTEEKVVRCDWADIARHVRAGGHVLFYAPGRLGIMVLDFDPLLTERLDSIENLLGAPAYRTFESSGKHKPAQGSRPAGKGGHACWRVLPERAEASADIRQFGAEADGDAYGEAFTGHDGFGVIVWNAVALLETGDLPEEEAVDPRLLHKARYTLGDRTPAGEWTGAEGSRHAAAMSALARAATGAADRAAFDEEAERIGEAFAASFTEADRRNVPAEWARMLAKGVEHFESDRAQDAINEARVGGVLTGRSVAPPEPSEEDGGQGIRFENKRATFLEMERLFGEFLRLDIRFNVRTFEDEYRPIGSTGDWQVVTDRVMLNWVKRTGRKCLRKVAVDKNGKGIYAPDTRTREAFEKDYAVWFSAPELEVDPFIDWLETDCGEYDGVQRIDTWLRDAGVVITNGNEEYVRWVCRYLVLAPVQRAYEPGCELQQIPVLWGPRGTGKSSVAEYLMPVNGAGRRMWYSDDFRLLPDSKQMIEMTEGNAVIEWPELRGIVKIDSEEIKSYISGKTDRARKAYAKRVETVPRRWALVGTTNEPTLKADPALMRRIVVLHVAEGSDVGEIRAYLNAHRHLLFAEALHRYKAGERAHLDYHLEDGLDLNNAGAVWRNWAIIETIQEVVGEVGSDFTKEEFCEAIGEIPANADRRERRRIRDKWWRENGRRYTKALIDLGFTEGRDESGRRAFLISDRSVYDRISREGSVNHPRPPSDHPSGTDIPRYPPNHPSPNEESNRGGKTGNTDNPLYVEGGSPANWPYKGLRVVDGGNWMAPDDLGEEPEP